MGRSQNHIFAADFRHLLYKSCVLSFASTTCVAMALMSVRVQRSVPTRLPSPISVT